MGTNYYLHKKTDACPTCGHREPPQHIGKSSAGWCFTLRIDPDHGITDLDDWIYRWSAPDVYILDEYGQTVTPADMLADVTQRTCAPRTWSPADYDRNGAVPGPYGLARHKIGRFCVKHGTGTWDCVVGEFS